VAHDLMFGLNEAHWRASVVHAYYTLMLECRDALARWGRSPPPRDNVHSFVRLQLTYASDQDLKRIGDALGVLVRRRNQASYQLTGLTAFSTRRPATDSYQEASDALALLDAIEADPARRAAAIASLPPPPP
jgi:hypothetical protein